VTPSISASPDAARKDGLDAILADPALIRPVFQPIVDLKRSTVVGFEMLARFAAEPHGTPLEWLAAAERHGMATALEAQLVELGVAARDRLPPNTFLSVNVSPEALLSAEVQGALASATGGLGRLVIEVTEQSRVEDYAELARALARSRAAGAAVAVDDTGAGYASLAHVMRLRPEFVKLDRGLVADADLDPAKLALIEAVGAFAARLDAWIVAEGIERRAEQELLAGLSVPLGQGYLFGRPGPALDVVLDAAPVRLAASGSGLAGLVVKDAPVLDDGAPVPPLAAGSVAVVRDGDGRPVGLVLPHSDGTSTRRETLVVGLGERVADVASRAMSRPLHTRFDPVCCCDADGSYAGLIPVERLVHALAGRPAA
jgi:EAL domain-containing protein (putative c-di-GMP-specific phosphodiesterase class I)